MTWLTRLAYAGAGLSAVALGLTAINAWTWPRGRRRGRLPANQRVSILIPARNEEAHIAQCVRAAWSSEHPILEVIVCDDQSEDKTPAILRALQEERARVQETRRPMLHVIGQGEDASPLPRGWVGKPYACHRLAKAARGDVLLFVDADTQLDYDGVSRLASLFAEFDADVVSAVPRQITRSFFERLILPLLHVTYTSWFPLALTWRSRDERFLAANGQVMAIRQEMYDRAGGFEAIKGELVDDMELCKRVKRAGGRVVFADGHLIAQCRMYDSAREVWEGFSKNIYPGLGARPLVLLGVLALYGTTFILPYVTLALSARHPARRELFCASLLGVSQNIALRLLLARRHEHSVVSALLHPFGVASLLAIAVNSARWHALGSIKWSGRLYGGGEAPLFPLSTTANA